MKTPRFPARIALLMAAGLLLPATGLAAKWVTVSTSPESTAWLDQGGIVRRGDVVQAWELEKFTIDQENKAWEGRYRAVKSLMSYDCARRTTEPVLRVYLSAEGAELKRVHMQGLQFPAAVEPDSLREKMLALACAAPKDKGPDKVAARPETRSQPGLIPEAAAAETEKPQPATPAVSPGDRPVAASVDATPAQAAPVKVAALARDTGAPSARRAAPASRQATRATPVVMRREQRTQPVPRPQPARSAADIQWTYTGERGAANWGALSPEFATCSQGKLQSPIDIRDGARLDLEPIEFSYPPSALRIVDTGHTVQVNVDAGRHIVVMGRRYDLKQLHFHKPAEERIDGRSYDMSAHLLHKDVDGRIAMVAVLFEAGEENAFLRRLWPYLPLERGREAYLPEVKLELDRLLPESRTYYTYMGSLTTPPCTEGVLWIVMKTPVPISVEQVAVFSRLYPMNARPVQASNGRFIKESM